MVRLRPARGTVLAAWRGAFRVAVARGSAGAGAETQAVAGGETRRGLAAGELCVVYRCDLLDDSMPQAQAEPQLAGFGEVDERFKSHAWKACGG